MRITAIEAYTEGCAATLRAAVQPARADSARDLWFRFEGLDGPLETSADPFAAAMLPFCMHEGEGCRIEGALSPVLAENMKLAQDRLAGWYDFLSPVEVAAEAETPANSWDRPDDRTDGAVVCCFSGGVDSWYSLLKNAERVTHLLLVRGFDIGLDNAALWQSTRTRIAEVAAAMGLRLIVCETNLRELADARRADWGKPCDFDFWGQCLHGAALAAISLALPRSFGGLIVPATHSEDQLKPWGSSPQLDPLWSNERMRIRHDGCEAGRTEKVQAISGSRLALQSLRVCHNDLAETNCGRCEKCIRTMLALRLSGVLEQAETFPDTRALRRLRRLEVPAHLIHHYESLLSAARQRGDSGLIRAIEAILGRRFSAERSLAGCVRSLRRGLRETPGAKLAGNAQRG
ncbi:MAG: hypothetical protein WDZ84_14385 [Rhodovibrionaceae bacterium]